MDGQEGSRTSERFSSVEARRLLSPLKRERNRPQLKCPALLAGRYVTRRELGSGGSAVVYLADDQRLDREVALKVCWVEAENLQGQERLRKEAQALARMEHHNVVTVFDWHIVDDLMMISMEFVDGQTLREWSKSSPGYSAILKALTDVARGLVHVHANEIVHRDLKPDNVMIDHTDRVRIMDFGLARDRSGMIAFPDENKTVSGTPGYMAPEQLQRLQSDEKADQFSWSTMAWELLCGAHPFLGDTPDELRRSILEGHRRPLPRGRRPPQWLQRILERGLHADPARRWPSMQSVLKELERGRAWAWLRVAFALFVLIVVGVVGVWLQERAQSARSEERMQKQIQACREAGRRSARRGITRCARLSASLLAPGMNYGPDVERRLVSSLDEYAEHWRRTTNDACLDVSVNNKWSGDTFARSETCMAERRMELQALVGELLTPDAQMVAMAIPAAVLAPIDLCRDPVHLQRLALPPSLIRDKLQKELPKLWATRIQMRLGRYRAALGTAQSVVQEAEAINWTYFVLEAKLQLSEALARNGFFGRAERLLESVYFEAKRSEANELAVDASLGLVKLVGLELERPIEALRWGQHASLILAELGDSENMRRAILARYQAEVYQAKGEGETALEFFEQEQKLLTKALGTENLLVARSLADSARLLATPGRFSRADRQYERALTIQETILGSEHPDVAQTLIARADFHLWISLYAAAAKPLAKITRAAPMALVSDLPGAIFPEDVVDDLPEVANALARAEKLYERGRSLQESAFGTEHGSLTYVFQGLAKVALAQHRPNEAVLHSERAVALSSRGVQALFNCFSPLRTRPCAMGEQSKSFPFAAPRGRSARNLSRCQGTGRGDRS
ncbi:serine/threonine-protein kinase [Nannocystis pusilla]|uniref:serine/threonine-protein kinase n=1 Tax=Nannocystis pusilla TaxID=889268 RepID=UPI003B79342B